ncbi:MAG: hypothetical protein ACYTXE_41260, partial [Nostoc sp.]
GEGFEKNFDVTLTLTPRCIGHKSFFTIFFPDNSVYKLRRGCISYQLSNLGLYSQLITGNCYSRCYIF